MTGGKWRDLRCREFFKSHTDILPGRKGRREHPTEPFRLVPDPECLETGRRARLDPSGVCEGSGWGLGLRLRLRGPPRDEDHPHQMKLVGQQRGVIRETCEAHTRSAPST